MGYRWYDTETVMDDESEALRFVLPRGLEKGETTAEYRVEVWHARHGFLGLVSVKTLGRLLGRAKRYERFVLDREEPEVLDD